MEFFAARFDCRGRRQLGWYSFQYQRRWQRFQTLVHHDNYNGAQPYGPVIVTKEVTGRTDALGMTLRGGYYDRGVMYRYCLEDGEFETLYAFGANASEPRYPWGGLLQHDGAFYGLTEAGGAYGSGALFRYAGGDVEVVASFDGSNGATPLGSLIRVGGYVYGTTAEGGDNENGVIFRTDPEGNGEIKVLHSFNYEDGSAPQSTLLHSGSWLFGTTYGGGPNGFGTIFRIQEDGSNFQVIHSFNETDGSFPQGQLALIGSTLYGVAINGGAYGKGTLFQIQTDGTGFQVLHSFSGTDGAYPAGGLVASGNTLFGVTYRGGENDLGTVFAYAIPEPSTALLLLLAPMVWRLRIHRRRKFGR